MEREETAEMRNEEKKERVKDQTVVCPDKRAVGDRGQATRIP